MVVIKIYGIDSQVVKLKKGVSVVKSMHVEERYIPSLNN